MDKITGFMELLGEDNKEQIKEQIIEKSDMIAEILSKGKKDVELRKSANGVSVAEVSKKVVSR